MDHQKTPVSKKRECAKFYQACFILNVQNFIAWNHRAVSHADFCSLFSHAWTSAMNIKNVIASFTVSSMYPFDRKVLVLPEKQYSLGTLPEISGLKYIPLYSPACPWHKFHTYIFLLSVLHRRFLCQIDKVLVMSLYKKIVSEVSIPIRNHFYITYPLDRTLEESKCLMPLCGATSLSDILVTPKKRSN